jgi:hypothetical protein
MKYSIEFQFQQRAILPFVVVPKILPNYCLYGFRVRRLYVPSQHNTPLLDFPKALGRNKLSPLSLLTRVLYGFGITWHASRSFVPQNALENETLLALNV